MQGIKILFLEIKEKARGNWTYFNTGFKPLRKEYKNLIIVELKYGIDS